MVSNSAHIGAVVGPVTWSSQGGNLDLTAGIYRVGQGDVTGLRLVIKYKGTTREANVDIPADKDYTHVTFRVEGIDRRDYATLELYDSGDAIIDRAVVVFISEEEAAELGFRTVILADGDVRLCEDGSLECIAIRSVYVNSIGLRGARAQICVNETVYSIFDVPPDTIDIYPNVATARAKGSITIGIAT